MLNANPRNTPLTIQNKHIIEESFHDILKLKLLPGLTPSCINAGVANNYTENCI